VTSIGFHGNVVAVWERFVVELETTGERLVDLGSDQVPLGANFDPRGEVVPQG
jgi:hypothetical protein